MQIKFKINNKQVVLEIENDEITILELKKKLESSLEDNMRIPAEQQKFVIHGSFLDNKKTVKECEITEKSVIYVIATKKITPVAPKKEISVPKTEQNIQHHHTPAPSSDSFNNLMSSQLDNFINDPSALDAYFSTFMGNMTEEQKASWRTLMTEQLREMKKNPQMLRSMMSQFSNMGQDGTMGMPGMNMSMAQSPYTMPQPSYAMPQSPYNVNTPGMYVPSPTVPCNHGFFPISFLQQFSAMSPSRFVSSEPPNYEEFYKEQLKQLEEMGYVNKEVNLNALKACSGDINDAIDWIIEYNSKKK